jgi:hypothetical protein
VTHSRIRADGQKEMYSTDGIVCPQCETLISPDSSSDYNQTGFDLMCNECETKFNVVPHVVWSWSTWISKT